MRRLTGTAREGPCLLTSAASRASRSTLTGLIPRRRVRGRDVLRTGGGASGRCEHPEHPMSVNMKFGCEDWALVASHLDPVRESD
jgi:hypothetical protein